MCLVKVSGSLPLIEWLKELMVDGREFIQSASCNQQFNLLVDASAFGGGYVLKNGTGGALWSRAYAWNGKEFNYHINRLEGLSLLKALREVAKSYPSHCRQTHTVIWSFCTESVDIPRPGPVRSQLLSTLPHLSAFGQMPS